MPEIELIGTNGVTVEQAQNGYIISWSAYIQGQWQVLKHVTASIDDVGAWLKTHFGETV